MPSHLIISDVSKALQMAQSIAPFPLKSSPDCLMFETEGSLKIAEVRRIKHFLTRKPYQNEHQLVYLPDADRLTIPAQNALLKTLEEPPATAIIILTTGFPNRLLATIVSRCFIHQANSAEKQPVDSSSFLPLYQSVAGKSIGQRMIQAQLYAYPKTKAVFTLQLAINFSREQLHASRQLSSAKNAALAQQMLLYLESNVDPKLCLEHFFLHLI